MFERFADCPAIERLDTGTGRFFDRDEVSETRDIVPGAGAPNWNDTPGPWPARVSELGAGAASLVKRLGACPTRETLDGVGVASREDRVGDEDPRVNPTGDGAKRLLPEVLVAA